MVWWRRTPTRADDPTMPRSSSSTPDARRRPSRPRGRSAAVSAGVWRGLSRGVEILSEATTRGFDRVLPPGSPRLRRAEIAGASLLGLAVLGGALWGVPALRRHADVISREAAMPAAGPRVVFLQNLDWIPPAEEDRLAATVSASLAGRSVIDHDALRGAAEALASTGWFDGPPRLRRAARHRVEVDAPWRRAAAVVRDRGTDHLVDTEGHRLPLAWASGSAPSTLVVIDGLAESAPRRPGERWKGGALTIALRVLPQLAGRPWSDQIATLDVSTVAEGGPIVLGTVRGGRLIWGRPDAGAAEVPVATRLAWLDALHAGSGTIDPPPARQFDLRLDYLASAPRQIAVR